MRTTQPAGVLWQHAGFKRLWAAQAISTFGARIAREGLPLAAVLTIHASPGEVGVLAALSLGPSIIVGLLSGGFVDRARQRRIMILADLGRAAVLTTVPLAAALHILSIYQLYAVAACVGGASTLFDIADHAYLPRLIGRGALMEGNSKLAVTESVAEIGGPALNGVMVQFLTAPIALALNALTYLFSAGILTRITDERATEPPKQRRLPHHDIMAGLAAIFESPLVAPMFLMAVFSPLFGAFFNLYSLFALRGLGLSPSVLGMTIAVGGVGALLGAGIAQFLTNRIGAGPSIILCGLVSAASALLIPLATGPLWLRVLMLMAAQLVGDSLGVAAIIPATALRQSRIARDKLGRTAALFRAGAGATAFLGALLGGFIADRIGVRETLLIGAIGNMLIPLVAVLTPLRKVKDVAAAPVE